MQLQLTNELLETVCDPFDFTNPPYDPVELSNAMTLFREEKGGIGLAANQVGIPLRVISIKGFDSALFNPKIVSTSDETILLEEGCLSFPGLAVKVKRPRVVRLRYTDAFNVTVTKVFQLMTARVICHEVDHLDGILFYSRAHVFHREQAFRQWRKKMKVAK